MSTERIQTNLNEFRDRIEELYRFRDEYFLQNSENLYVRKRDIIETKTMVCESCIFLLKLCISYCFFIYSIEFIENLRTTCSY